MTARQSNAARAPSVQTEPTSPQTPTPPTRSHLNHFIAGEIAGMFGAIISHPIDTVKTRLQIEMLHNQHSSQQLGNNHTIHVLKSILRTDGITGIYKGVLAPFLGYGLTSALVFGVNNASKNAIIKYKSRRNKSIRHDHDSKHRLSLSELAICGGFTGFIHTFLVTPIERIKIWSQSNKTGTLQSLLSLYKSKGIIKGLFGGISYSLAFQVITYSAYFPIYECTLKMLTMRYNPKQKRWQSMYQIGCSVRRNKRDVSSTKIMFAGASAGVISWIIGYPLDTIKTRIQSGFYTDKVSMKALTRNYSYHVSYNGLMPALYRAAILHSSVFLMYERVLQTVDRYQGMRALEYS